MDKYKSLFKEMMEDGDGFSIIIKDYNEELERLKGSLKYLSDVLSSDLEDWERKEYKAVEKMDKERIKEIEQTLKNLNKAKK